jgi:Ca2+-dependent lipid-binding protein
VCVCYYTVLVASSFVKLGYPGLSFLCRQHVAVCSAVEFAKDLKDRDWFGKQDPYCILALGSQKVRSRTHIDGGKAPVWNETFNFQVINDNTVYIAVSRARLDHGYFRC